MYHFTASCPPSLSWACSWQAPSFSSTSKTETTGQDVVRDIITLCSPGVLKHSAARGLMLYNYYARYLNVYSNKLAVYWSHRLIFYLVFNIPHLQSWVLHHCNKNYFTLSVKYKHVCMCVNTLFPFVLVQAD